MRLTKEWQRRPQPWPQPRQGRQEGLFHTCAIGSQVLPPFNLYHVVSRPASQIESTVNASIGDGKVFLFSRQKAEFVDVLKIG